MNSLERAINTTEEIREALAVEIAFAREERVLIRSMNIDGLFERAAKRQDFNVRTAGLQQRLGAELGEVARGFGMEEVTLDGLTEREPALGARMSSVLAEVRSLASALAELDSLNKLLGQRALSYVRAHLSVLSPRPAAYDRRGSAAAAPPRSSTTVRVV